MATLTETTWRGRPAWRFANDQVVVIITHTGAQLAAIHHSDDDLNPFWQPPWPAKAGNSLSDEELVYYGGALVGPLLADIVGHNLCCDRFGAPWPGRAQAAAWRSWPNALGPCLRARSADLAHDAAAGRYRYYSATCAGWRNAPCNDDSSAVEQLTVNQLVAGSNPARGMDIFQNVGQI